MTVYLAASAMSAQPLAIGVKGGAWTTSDFSGTLTPESKRYIVGPSVELRLPFRLSVEADALYRRVAFTGYASNFAFNSITRERDNSWEFPLILKYRLPFPILHPFAGVGYAPRIVSGADVASGSVMDVQTGAFTYFNNGHSTVSYPVTNGVVISGGLNFDARHFRLTPEVRYVHWSQPFLNAYGGDGSFHWASPQDEFYVMLGLAWR